MESLREKVETLNFAGLFEEHQKTSLRLRTEPVGNRKKRLEKLSKWIHQNRPSIHEAMFHDLGKPSVEVDAIELFHVLNEIKLAISNLDDWSQPKKIDAPLTMLGTRSVIQYEPKGVCLIISPWNYPFSLAIGPLVSALAAGNTAIIKPSEYTSHVSVLLKKMVKELFDENEVAVIEGPASTSEELLKLPFDHIFFTGSPGVGKIVMKAAAENLASVTLELGGKSPCIVHSDANLNDAAERIVVGKFVNNGQTCVAPDYLLVDQKVVTRLTDLIIKKTKSIFGNNGDFQSSESYCRIINLRNHQRLVSLVEDAVLNGAKVLFSGPHNEETKFFHPVILTDIPESARLLREEIFGPVLPIITYTDLATAINFVNERPKPLALYLFTQSRKIEKAVLSNTSAGGACINDIGLQFLNHNLPFGGVNNSGFGKSHGYYGFLTFSNEKPVLKQKNGLTSVKILYPPYTSTSRKIMDWFLKLF
jgi:aldehyde dehydrogenase (NAD+)